MLNFIKHNRKLLNAGKMKADRIEKFNELQALGLAKAIFIGLRQGSTKILITNSPSGNRYLTKKSMMSWLRFVGSQMRALTRYQVFPRCTAHK